MPAMPFCKSGTAPPGDASSWRVPHMAFSGVGNGFSRHVRVTYRSIMNPSVAVLVLALRSTTPASLPFSLFPEEEPFPTLALSAPALFILSALPGRLVWPAMSSFPLSFRPNSTSSPCRLPNRETSAPIFLAFPNYCTQGSHDSPRVNNILYDHFCRFPFIGVVFFFQFPIVRFFHS
jgi:hypothetical protein